MFYSLLAPDAAQNVNVNMENITASQQKQKKKSKSTQMFKVLQEARWPNWDQSILF